MVIYYDIRSEMVDHIASEIETKISEGDQRSFETIFKEYMLINRLRLLDGNNRIVSRLTKELAQKGFNKLCRIHYIIGFLFLVVLYNFSIELFTFSKVVWGHLILNLSLMMGFILVYEFKIRIKKMPRFSGIERSGVLIALLVTVVFFTFQIKGLYMESFQLIYAIFLSAQLIITIAFLKLGVEQYIIYSNRLKVG